MKNKYYGYAFGAIVVIILVAAVINSNTHSSNGQVSSATDTSAPITTTTTTTSSEGQKTATAAPSGSPAQYYPIDSYYLTVNSAVYYKPDSSVAQMIKVSNPPLHSSLSSPLVVNGTAIGTWYSANGTFPVILTDKNGKIIAQGLARALANWKNFDMVSFSTTLTFIKQISQSNGVLILKKSNTTGLASNDASIEIAVEFQ